MSVNLPFLLTAVVNLSAAEAVGITFVSTVAQCWPQKNTKFPEQMAFNVSMMSLASCLASLMFHAQWLHGMQSGSITLGLVLATVTLFLGQTAPVATIVALSEGKAAGPMWWSLAHLSSVLRGQRRRYLDGAGRRLTHGMGTGARSLPDHVRYPSLLPRVLCAEGGNPASGASRTSRGRRSVADHISSCFSVDIELLHYRFKDRGRHRNANCVPPFLASPVFSVVNKFRTHPECQSFRNTRPPALVTACRLAI